MRVFQRYLTYLGLIIFAATFFLPLGFYNSPLGRFRWSLDSVFLAESPGESMAFVGICLAIAYPYIWALTSAYIFFFNRYPGRWAVRIQFLCHLFGGIPITVLGLTLILLKAEFPPVGVQWIALLFPVGLILILLVIATIVKPPRRFPALVATALILFTPLQFILYHFILLDGGFGWGYLLGGGGALIGLIGSSALIFRS